MNGKALTPFSIQGHLSEFFRAMAAKTQKNTHRDNDVQTFLGEEENQIRKEKLKVTYSVALVMAFLAAENANRQLKDLLRAVFGRVPEIFLLSVRQIL